METSRIDNQVPFMAIHPTEIIKDEIKERGMSQKELAERLGMQASNVSRMFREKETITSALAVKLEKALGIDMHMDISSEPNEVFESIKKNSKDIQNEIDKKKTGAK